MSYRHLLVGIAAVAFAMPVLAEQAAQNQQNEAAQQQAIQIGANGNVSVEGQALADNTAANANANAPAANAAAAPAAHADAHAADAHAAATDAKVDINKASVDDLKKIKGMNAAKAKAIVAYRKKHGDFKSLDDLSKVKGFKKMKADEMKAITDHMSI